jgi:16S rRNA (uracil1498-N3)-methyltransferase
LLSFRPDSLDLRRVLDSPSPRRAWRVLNGPEGGLNAQEEAAAMAQGFVPVALGPRVLRAETAPLAVLAALATLF